MNHLLAHIRLIRPGQITKNFLCFAGLIFGERFHSWHYVLAALQTVLAFYAVAAAGYALNDVLDRERDRLHPRKRRRPVASGAVRPPVATAMALMLLLAGLIGGWLINPLVLACLVVYASLTAAYSLGMKHALLFDVCCIGLGFVLRLLAGIYAVDDVPTTWITLCTFFLSVFVGFAKRRAELGSLMSDADAGRRPILKRYTVPYLNSLLGGSAVMTIMTYALFTTASNKSPNLVITVPLVYYAVMHYKWLVLVGNKGEEPEHIVLSDWRLQAAIVAWFIAYFAALHAGVQLFR